MADKALKIRGYFWDLENATWRANWVAGGLGFEPRQAESESAVLPLDDPPTGSMAYGDGVRTALWALGQDACLI